MLRVIPHVYLYIHVESAAECIISVSVLNVRQPVGELVCLPSGLLQLCAVTTTKRTISCKDLLHSCSRMHIRPSAALNDICDIKNKARFWSLSRECDGSKPGSIVWKQLPRCYRLWIARVDTRRRRSGMRGAGENPQEDGRDVRIGGFWFQRWLQLCMTGFWCGGDRRGFRMFDKKDDNSINSKQFSLHTNIPHVCSSIKVRQTKPDDAVATKDAWKKKTTQ